MTNHLKQIFSGAKVVVTGHTGFKGSWLSLWLCDLGANVTGISLDIPTEPSHFKAGRLDRLLKDYRLDIRNNSDLKSLVSDIQPDFLFHLAAQPIVKRSFSDPVETWLTNTIGTVNVLEALRALEKRCVAVLITSDKCYDNVEWVWGYRETDSLGGSDPYSASKGAAELAIRSYVRSYFPADGLVRLGVGRAGNVIGGGDWAEDRIIPDCVRAWCCEKPVQLRNPDATRPWQHVLEPLGGYLSLANALNKDSKLHGQPFNFGPSMLKNHSVGELVSAMSKYWDKVQWEDVSSLYGGPHESSLLKLNCDKAIYHLNWQAALDFETTVKMTAEWYKTYYSSSNDISELSLSQIHAYTEIAKKKGLPWAQ